MSATAFQRMRREAAAKAKEKDAEPDEAPKKLRRRKVATDAPDD